MSSEKEMLVVAKSTILDICLIIKQSEKESYTKEEMLDLLYKVAAAKDQAP